MQSINEPHKEHDATFYLYSLTTIKPHTKMTINRKTLRAGLIAPLAGPISLYTITSIAAAISHPSSLTGNYGELISLLILFIVLGAPFGYLVALIFGLPAYMIMKKLGRINFWTISIGSTLASLAPTFILSTWLGFNQPSAENNPANLYWAMAVSGFVVGVVFWLINGPSYKNNSQKAKT